MPQKGLKTNNVWVCRLACGLAKSGTQNTWQTMLECQKSCKGRYSLQEWQKSQTPSYRERASCRRYRSTTYMWFGRWRKVSKVEILPRQTDLSLMQSIRMDRFLSNMHALLLREGTSAKNYLIHRETVVALKLGKTKLKILMREILIHRPDSDLSFVFCTSGFKQKIKQRSNTRGKLGSQCSKKLEHIR